jgi:DNA repair photolyase
MENFIPGEIVKAYDREGLKIDRDRVLTYSQLSCPLGCTYCFVNDMNTNQQRNVLYLTETQIDLLGNLPEEVKLIMLGCDTEFFQNKQEAIAILKRLSKLGKDISMITKIPVAESLLEEISQINDDIGSRGNVLSVSVSIPFI